jgi:predicted PurR-regulated permease PerM
VHQAASSRRGIRFGRDGEKGTLEACVPEESPARLSFGIGRELKESFSAPSPDRCHGYAMTTPARISYAVLAGTLLLVGILHLGVPFLAVFFSYFTLRRLFALTKSKWRGLVLFILVVVAIGYAGVHFTRAAVKALPDIAENSIPSASAWAQARQIELPFTDFESLRAVVIDTLKEQAHYIQNLAQFARAITSTLVFVIIGIVIAVSLFFNSRMDSFETRSTTTDNLYAVIAPELADRFHDFYRSFATVIGAQISISLINTVLTAAFVLAVGLPHAAVVITITFLCGLLPIVGNLISNTIIVCVAFTISLKMAGFALIFLIAVHKLEYFLNSKIIGDRIRNPVWLTLIALILGEQLMGIPGMILAPVVLNYLRVELSKIPSVRPRQLDAAA